MEDSRHSVSDRVLQHFKSLKNGEAPAQEEATGRKPLEGDWYISSTMFVTHAVQSVSRICLNHLWRIQSTVKLCVATTSTKSVSMNGQRVNNANVLK